MIDAILVPQGQEYQAVCRGLAKTTSGKILVLPIPVGSKSLTPYLKKCQQLKNFPPQQKPRVLLMGLCGSLSPQYKLREIVIYQGCVYATNQDEKFWQSQECDRQLTASLQRQLQERAYLVTGLTSDRLLCSSEEKRHLGQIYQTGVVDMEGFAALEVLKSAGVAVAMVRVISDDCYQDLPNIERAITSEGNIEPLPLAIAFLRQPLAAARLIRGSLQALRILEQVTRELTSKDRQ